MKTKQWDMMMLIIPIVKGATGTIPKNSGKDYKNFEFEEEFRPTI